MARIKLPKKQDYLTLRNWLLEHKYLSTKELSRLSGITLNKIREWMIYCDVVDIKDGELFKIWVNYKNYSPAEACVILGITNASFRKALNRNNINKFRVKPRVAKTKSTPTIKLPRTKEEFEELLDKYSIPKIAQMSGLSRQIVIRIKNRHGIESPRKDKYSIKNVSYNDTDWLKEHYVNQKMSMRKCAEMAGVAPNTIRNWLISHGIIPRPRLKKNATLQAGIP